MTQPLKSNGSLFKKVAKGGFWIFSISALEKSLGLIRLIILARLIAPNDFGLFGIALLIISTFETFSDACFQPALVQKKENIDSYLDTVWTLSALRGIVLFILLSFSSPYIAIFFNNPESSLIIQVVGISILLNGFTNTGILYFQKEMEFNRQFIYRLFSTLTHFIVAVSTVLILKNVWALVFGQLAGGIAALISSYLLHPYRPRINVDLGKARELFGFGKWILGSSILVFFVTQGDDFFVGKLLGATALGFYQMAYRISSMPTTEITHVISKVTFPAYSKMQDNLPRLREAYLRVLELTTFFSFPIAGLIFALAPDFTNIFLGKKWMPMVPAMEVLVLAGMIRSIAATTAPVFMAVKKPEADTKWQIIRLLVMVILIYPLTIHWGIFGTSIAVFFSILVSAVGFSYTVLQVTKCRFQHFAGRIALPFVNTAIMVSIIFILKINFPLRGFLQFFLISGTGCIVYLCITGLYDKFLNYGMIKNMRNILSLS